jgi:hypothetical protein
VGGQGVPKKPQADGKVFGSSKSLLFLFGLRLRVKVRSRRKGAKGRGVIPRADFRTNSPHNAADRKFFRF